MILIFNRYKKHTLIHIFTMMKNDENVIAKYMENGFSRGELYNTFSFLIRDCKYNPINYIHISPDQYILLSYIFNKIKNKYIYKKLKFKII